MLKKMKINEIIIFQIIFLLLVLKASDVRNEIYKDIHNDKIVNNKNLNKINTSNNKIYRNDSNITIYNMNIFQYFFC